MNDYWLHWVCICIRDENVERKTHGGSNTSDCWAGNSSDVITTAGRETGTRGGGWGPRQVTFQIGCVHLLSRRICLPAAAEIPIYVCIIPYSCFFNNHIYYRKTVIKATKIRKDRKKLAQLWFLQRCARRLINNSTNNQVCRKANKSGRVIPHLTDRIWQPLGDYMVTVSPLTRWLGGWGEGEGGLCLGGSVPVNVKTLFTPPSGPSPTPPLFRFATQNLAGFDQLGGPP